MKVIWILEFNPSLHNEESRENSLCERDNMDGQLWLELSSAPELNHCSLCSLTCVLLLQAPQSWSSRPDQGEKKGIYAASSLYGLCSHFPVQCDSCYSSDPAGKLLLRSGGYSTWLGKAQASICN